MSRIDLHLVPEAHRSSVTAALEGAFGRTGASDMAVVVGGASGALTYRVESPSGPHLLRVETNRGPMRNPHQYGCMLAAADAGIAPPIRYVDDVAGVLIVPFLTQRPLVDFPGGMPALAEAVAGLLARLHETPMFPVHRDRMESLGQLLALLEGSGRVAPGLLAEHAEGFAARIRAAYPWQPDTFVSSHNDPNEFNLIFDGDRLWLIDWETAARDDPFVDLACAGMYLGPTSELREVILRVGLGRAPGPLDHARLTLMSQLTRLFAGTILLLITVDPARATHTDLTPMTGEAFGHAIATGELVAGTVETTLAFAKLSLGQFRDVMRTPEVHHALEVAAAG